jgi:hypothetical protein
MCELPQKTASMASGIGGIMRPFDHIFNGVEYKVIADADMLGVTLDGVPHAVVLWTDLRKKLGLQIACHEAIHCLLPNLPERIVSVMGDDLGEYLWKLGFRSTK